MIMSGAKEEIQQALDRGEPEPWIWTDDGSEVVGVALRKERRSTKHGAADFLILEVDGDERSVLVGNEVLIKKLKASQLQAGEWVGIRRLGERQPTTANGRPYIDFKVVVAGRKNQALEWGDTKALPETVDAELVEYSDDDAPVDYEG
jgi:hypothetical protein